MSTSLISLYSHTIRWLGFLLFCSILLPLEAHDEPHFPYCLDTTGSYYMPVLEQTIKRYKELGKGAKNRHQQLLQDAKKLESPNAWGKQFFFWAILDQNFKKAKLGVTTFLKEKGIEADNLVFIKVKASDEQSKIGTVNISGIGETPYVTLKLEYTKWYINKLETIISYDALTGVQNSPRLQKKANIQTNWPLEKKKEAAYTFLVKYLETFTNEIMHWEILEEIFYAEDLSPNRGIKVDCKDQYNESFTLCIQLAKGQRTEAVLAEGSTDETKQITLKGYEPTYDQKNRKQLFLCFKAFMKKKKWIFDPAANAKNVADHENSEINQKRALNRKKGGGKPNKIKYFIGSVLLFFTFSRVQKKNIKMDKKGKKVVKKKSAKEKKTDHQKDSTPMNGRPN